MRFAPFVLASSVLLCNPVVSEGESRSRLIEKLSSPSLAERREAVRSLDPEKIGNLEPELAVRAVLIAAQDADASVRQWALGGLASLTTMLPAADTNASAAGFANVIKASPELRPLLERIVIQDETSKVAFAASIPLMALYGSDPATETLVLDRADREPDVFERLKLLGSLQIGGIDGALTFDRLARYLDGAPLPIQIKAAHLLISTNTNGTTTITKLGQSVTRSP